MAQILGELTRRPGSDRITGRIQGRRAVLVRSKVRADGAECWQVIVEDVEHAHERAPRRELVLTNLPLGGQPAPCQNVVVRRCSFANGDGGLTVGSEMSGGVRNVFAEELSMTNPELEIAVRLKTNSFRGGRIENIHVRNVQVPTGVTNRAISIDYFYEEGKGGPFRPEVTDVFVSNMTVGPNPDSASEDYAIYLRGYATDPADPIGRVRISNCSFSARKGNRVDAVTDLRMSNVMLNGKKVES